MILKSLFALAARPAFAVLAVSLLAFVSSCGGPQPGGESIQPIDPSAEEPPTPRVELATSFGTITLELDAERAPKSVANFLEYVNSGFFDNTVFHRVIKGFMVQGGGFALDDDGEIRQKDTRDPIENEADNGLKNARGTIAMARTNDPHSATAQFFINHGDNANLDQPASGGWGYAVFGKVVDGLEIVDAIAELETGTKALVTRGGKSPMRDVPQEDVVILSAKVVEE